MLFKRLGWTWYRPIGMDWFTHGYFKIAEPYGNDPITIGQYLDINDLPYEPYTNLNEIVDNKNGIFHSYDGENHIIHNAITYEMFKKIKFDYIIATHPAHGNWEELLQFQPTAKFVMQLGNEGQTTTAKNVLSSVWAYTPLPGQNIIYYHQEFDITKYRYEPPTNHTLIRSFVHLLPEKSMFEIYRSALNGFKMEAYGMATENGVGLDLPTQMRESAFGWHIKPADGYGAVIHNWFACGRPIITKGSYYAGKTGGLLLEDDKTCIDLDKHTFEGSLERIRYWSQPDHHMEMCQNAYDRFKEIVDFDKEQKDIELFLSNTV